MYIRLRTATITIFVTLAILVIMPITPAGGLCDSALALNDAVTETDCRLCHCYAVPDTHHLLVQAGNYECLSCHQIKWDEVSQSYYTEIIRDCVVCHGNVVGTTHHLLVDNSSYECLDCHQLTRDEPSQSYFVELNLSCFNVPQGSNHSPVADAGPDQTVDKGNIVSFSAESSYDPDGNIVNYAWDFDDDTTGFGITTSHIYHNPGIYTITLTVTDDRGALDSDTAVIMVQEVFVNQPPVADAGSDQTVDAGQSVSFSAEKSYDPDGYIVDFAWDFGDGFIGSGINTSYTYDNPGVYKVTLSVIDDKGAVDTDIAVITVKVVSNSTRVYADEVLWIKSLKNVTDPDTMGIVKDITTKFINGRSNRHFDIVTKNADSTKVISMRATIEPSILSQVIISLQIRELSKNKLKKVRIYAYNSDSKSIIPGSFLDYPIDKKGTVDLDVTPISRTMNGYGWMKFRITCATTESTIEKVLVSKGIFVLK